MQINKTGLPHSRFLEEKLLITWPAIKMRQEVPGKERPSHCPVRFWCILPEPLRADACQDIFTPSLEAHIPVSLVSAPWTMLGSGAVHEALPGPSMAGMGPRYC